MIRYFKTLLITRAIKRDYFKNRPMGKGDYLYYLIANYEIFFKSFLGKLAPIGKMESKNGLVLAYLLVEIGEKIAFMHLSQLKDETYIDQWIELVHEWYTKILLKNELINSQSEAEKFHESFDDFLAGAYYSDNDKLIIELSQSQIDYFTFLLFYDEHAGVQDITDKIRLAKFNFDEWNKNELMAFEILKTQIPSFVQNLENLVTTKIHS